MSLRRQPAEIVLRKVTATLRRRACVWNASFSSCACAYAWVRVRVPVRVEPHDPCQTPCDPRRVHSQRALQRPQQVPSPQLPLPSTCRLSPCISSSNTDIHTHTHNLVMRASVTKLYHKHRTASTFFSSAPRMFHMAPKRARMSRPTTPDCFTNSRLSLQNRRSAQLYKKAHGVTQHTQQPCCTDQRGHAQALGDRLPHNNNKLVRTGHISSQSWFLTRVTQELTLVRMVLSSFFGLLAFLGSMSGHRIQRCHS
jgi:hypothetical protein